MGRAYATPIVGTGTEGDPFRPKIHSVRWPGGIPGVTRARAMISSDMSTGSNRGKPKEVWCAAWIEVRQVDGADDASVWAVVDADTENIFLGDLPLDDPAPSGVIQRMRQGGIITQQEANTITTYRSMIRLIVQKIYPHADETALLAGAV